MFQLQKYSATCIWKSLEFHNCRSIGSTFACKLYGDRGHAHSQGEVFTVPSRGISLSAPRLGKRNFRKFHLGNKRGSKLFRQERMEDPDRYPDIPIVSDVKEIGYRYGKGFRQVPEMIPEFIVPDLTDCQLKPYVSYRVADIVQEEFSPKELFNYVYQSKIEDDFKNGKLDDEGNSTEPNVEEKLTAEKAYLFARRTGSDLFSERIPKLWECLDNYQLEETVEDTSVYPPYKIPISRLKKISEKE